MPSIDSGVNPHLPSIALNTAGHACTPPGGAVQALSRATTCEILPGVSRGSHQYDESTGFSPDIARNSWFARQRRRAGPTLPVNTCPMAALMPPWASEITSWSRSPLRKRTAQRCRAAIELPLFRKTSVKLPAGSEEGGSPTAATTIAPLPPPPLQLMSSRAAEDAASQLLIRMAASRSCSAKPEATGTRPPPRRRLSSPCCP
jgi:hypothetical protein